MKIFTIIFLSFCFNLSAFAQQMSDAEARKEGQRLTSQLEQVLKTGQGLDDLLLSDADFAWMKGQFHKADPSKNVELDKWVSNRDESRQKLQRYLKSVRQVRLDNAGVTFDFQVNWVGMAIVADTPDKPVSFKIAGVKTPTGVRIFAVNQ